MACCFIRAGEELAWKCALNTSVLGGGESFFKTNDLADGTDCHETRLRGGECVRVRQEAEVALISFISGDKYGG